MKQPMYELAGMTKSEGDATDLDSLRKICQKYHVLGTAGMRLSIQFTTAQYRGFAPGCWEESRRRDDYTFV
jgi:hypothetical protein